MRVKIGLCRTDDLISIFRDLGMEMTLFSFKCFVLAPWLTVPLPDPSPQTRAHREHGWRGPSILQTTWRRTRRGAQADNRPPARAERKDLTRCGSHLHLFSSADLMHALKENKAEADSKRGSVSRDNLEDVWHLAFRSTPAMAPRMRSRLP